MCYPCTMCNGCGKFDHELFQYMIPRLLCLKCGAELPKDAGVCPECGAPRPPIPGQTAEEA
jgi:ribosomal protein L40E